MKLNGPTVDHTTEPNLPLSPRPTHLTPSNPSHFALPISPHPTHLTSPCPSHLALPISSCPASLTQPRPSHPTPHISPHPVHLTQPHPSHPTPPISPNPTHLTPPHTSHLDLPRPRPVHLTQHCPSHSTPSVLLCSLSTVFRPSPSRLPCPELAWHCFPARLIWGKVGWEKIGPPGGDGCPLFPLHLSPLHPSLRSGLYFVHEEPV